MLRTIEFENNGTSIAFSEDTEEVGNYTITIDDGDADTSKWIYLNRDQLSSILARVEEFIGIVMPK